MRFASRLMAAMGIFCAAGTTTAFAATIYVNAAASGANNGTSWANAYTSLQAALGAANSPDEIWVAAGTYRPHASDRTVSFAMENGVGIYGGFAGTETLRSQRNPKINVTILSGDIGTLNVANDNSYHVVTAAATVTASGALDGFTITAGQADGSPAAFNDRGAGMWNNGGSPTLARLTFSGNFAQGEGGALRVSGGAPIILSSTFQGNSVGFGGHGGGVYAGAGSSVTAQGCIFRSNTISSASTGGGGIEANGAGITLINSIVAQNSPNGLQVSSANGIVIDNSTFTANTAYGGAFFSTTGNSIANSIFWGNSTGQLCLGAPCTGSATVTYTDIQGGGIGGTGNIDADPLFLSAPADLRPGPLSPVVDAGNNAAVPGGVTVDVVGLPRFFDDPDVSDSGAAIIPPYVDMGAYERIPITVTTLSNQTLCSGSSAVFTVSATGQPTLTYRWRKNSTNLNNGGTVSGVTTDTLTINPTVTGDSGNYDVVVTDGFGQTITPNQASLSINGRPTAAASGGGTVCTGGSMGLIGSGGVSCAWLPATGLSNATSCTPIANPASTTTYSLTVMGANGCASTNTSTSTVTVNVTPGLPVITAPISVPVGASGASASAVNHPGSTWTWTLSGGTITAGQGSRQIFFDAASPGTTMQCTVTESAGTCASPEASTNLLVDFLDVPPSNPFHDYVVKIARNGVTAGCGLGSFCPTQPVSRAQMAVFLLKAKFGSVYVPPPATGTFFTDVPVNSFASAWIEKLAALGVTGGCGGTNYCPGNVVTRAQMAIFLLRTLNGSTYQPPTATGTIFADVSAGSFAAAWIEDLYSRNITGGCNTNPLRYCPNNANVRQQMAVFLTTTFQLH